MRRKKLALRFLFFHHFHCHSRAIHTPTRLNWRWTARVAHTKSARAFSDSDSRLKGGTAKSCEANELAHIQICICVCGFLLFRWLANESNIQTVAVWAKLRKKWLSHIHPLMNRCDSSFGRELQLLAMRSNTNSIQTLALFLSRCTHTITRHFFPIPRKPSDLLELNRRLFTPVISDYDDDTLRYTCLCWLYT